MPTVVVDKPGTAHIVVPGGGAPLPAVLLAMKAPATLSVRFRSEPVCVPASPGWTMTVD